MKFTTLIISLLLLCTPAHAALNKWVDEKGAVHYSDTVPPDVNKANVVHSMTGKGQLEAPVSSSPKTVAEREVELKKSRKEKEDSAAKKEQEDKRTAERAHNCLVAQQNLRGLEEGGRVVTYDAKGERTFLDDATREQRISEARSAASSMCD
ncbi:MAG: DUF4124 domain-containing protein [Sideroxydans sp.]|nr:DUF4124 domain-containing protein [Sideroxydans sp.]NOT98481.1 DUF4124 domain-containing protein [Sideroxydans sp.]